MQYWGIAMPLLSGGFEGLDAPSKGASPESAMQMFGDAARALSDELWVRRKAKAEYRLWLQKAAYHYITLMIQNGFSDLFEKRISNYDRGRRGPKRNVNVFQKGLLALFAHDKGVLQESERAYFGKRLWYAYRHYVPHWFVIGFLHEVWCADYERSLYLTHIEPEFEVWAILERATDGAPEARGKYSSAFEEKVKMARSAMDILSKASS